MFKTFQDGLKVSYFSVVSTLLALLITFAGPLRAHEVLPAIADMTQVDGVLDVDIQLNIESYIAGIDLAVVTDTNDAPEPQAISYDRLRALTPEALTAQFAAYWPQMQEGLTILVDGAAVTPVDPVLSPGPVGDVEIGRETTLSFRVPLPEDAQTVQMGWDPSFGELLLRQQGVEAPFTGLLNDGALSEPIALAGGGQASGWQMFFDYIPVGFDHIVPKGLDHILFVLGLFFLSTRMGPLLTQVSLFTLAHTITLAMAALGYVTLPGSIVEPLIAASITYVAIENIFMKNLSPWRPVIVFLFGLLHGLGFASVLGEFGLPEGAFIPALIGFNVGVEVGQLAVIAVMFLAVWQAIRIDRGANEATRAQLLYVVLILVTGLVIFLDPVALQTALENPVLVFLGPMLAIFVLCLASVTLRDHLEAYRRIVSIPASVSIGLVGAYWFVERVFL